MDKVTIHISANEQLLTSAECPLKVASNTVSYIEAVFELGENWTGYDSVRAVWSTYMDTIATVLDSEGKCVVPHEVMTRTQKVFVNLVGSVVEDDELTDRLTTYPILAVVVNADALVEGTETAPITPSQFEQFVAEVSEEVSKIKDIVSTTLNDDYTLTFVFSDGTETTVGPIRGEQGEQGIQGIQGPPGPPGEVTLATLESLMPTDTANGSIASFPDGQSVFPLKSCVVQINPIQDTSGGDPSPSNICPISGWNSVEVIDDPIYGGYINWNQLIDVKSSSQSKTENGVTFTDNRDGTYSVSTGSGGATSASYLSLEAYPVINGHKYLLKSCPNGGGNNTYRAYLTGSVGGGGYDIGNGFLYTASATGTTYCVCAWIASGQVLTTPITFKPQLFDLTQMFGAGNEPTTVDEFKAIFPNDYYAYNSGTKTNASAVNGTPYISHTTTLPSTVYGGTLDVVSGVLTIDRAYQTFDGTEVWTTGSAGGGTTFISPVLTETAISDSTHKQLYNMAEWVQYTDRNGMTINTGNNRVYVGSALTASSFNSDLTTFKTYLGNNPLQVCYYLATPTTIQLTPTQVQTLLGQNNIFADSGDVSVEYVADIQGYIDKQ